MFYVCIYLPVYLSIFPSIYEAWIPAACTCIHMQDMHQLHKDPFPKTPSFLKELFSSEQGLTNYSVTFSMIRAKEMIHPWRLTWNIIMEVWKIIFLSKWVICRVYVNLPRCIHIIQAPFSREKDHDSLQCVSSFHPCFTGSLRRRASTSKRSEDTMSRTSGAMSHWLQGPSGKGILARGEEWKNFW